MASLIPPSWQLPDSVVRRLGSGPGRQRIIAEDGHLVVVLHAIPNADDPTRRDARLFWRTETGTWRASATQADSTVGALRAHVESYFQTAESFEDRIEQARTADDWFELLQQVAPFARSARNLARVMQELRDRLGADADVIAIRDRAADVERAAELVQQWASQGLDYTIAKSNEEQATLSDYISRSGHRLNLLAAFTLPLTALGSLLGMNLASGLERAAAPYLFWGAGVLCVAIGALLVVSMPKPPARATVAPPRARPTHPNRR